MSYRPYLKPLSWAYGSVLHVRNRLYDRGVLPTYFPIQQCISVGNLSVGGTGKTPAVEYLLRYLLTLPSAITGQIATLSRGYGRQTRGFRVAAPTDTAATLGDEPLQLYQNFSPPVLVTVGERRADALRQLAKDYPKIRTVVLDDAYQHRAVLPHLNLLLTDYNRPFYTDDPFPAGLLRERRIGAARADAVIVTKCPHNPTPAQRTAIQAQVHLYTRQANVPVLFAGLAYGAARHLTSGQPAPISGPVRLVSGLANAGPLVRYVDETWGISQHGDFGDHHPYTRAELIHLLNTTSADTWLLTTQKDQVKLTPLLTPVERQTRKLAYLPVAMTFFSPTDAAILARLVDTCLRPEA